MKPVKLEILTEAKGDGFSKTESDMQKLQTTIEVQRQYIANLRADLAQLKADFSKSQEPAALKALNVDIVALEGELKDAEFALNILDKTMQDNQGSSKTLRTQIMNLKNDMANMTEGTEEYAQAMVKLGQLQDQYGDISQQGRVLADDERNIRATADAIAGLSGAMSAGVGVASLFGMEQEKLAEIQARLQAVMAITIGLQQVAQTLNKDSYFSIIVLTKVKKGWAAAQAFLNTQLGLGVVASRALMASGIGLLIGGIGLLVTAYQKWKSNQDDINKMRTEGIKSAQEEISQAKALESVLKNSNNTYAQRKAALDKLKEIMPGYNASLSTEGRLIMDNTGALKNYVEQLKNAALAKSAMERVVKAENAYTDWTNELPKEAQAALINADMGGESWNKHQDPVQAAMLKKLQRDRAKLEGEINKWQGELERYTAASIELTNKPAKTGGKNSATSSSSVPDNNLAMQRFEALKKIKEMEIAMMAEGEEKRKAQAELEYQNKLTEIAREKAEREKHVKELAKAKVPISQAELTAISTQSQEQTLLAKKQYEHEVAKIERETAENTKAIENELRLNFETRLNQQLADIDAYYNDLVKKAGANAALIAQIENARYLAKNNAKDGFALQQLDFEEQMALKRAEIVKKNFKLQSDAEEKLLKLQVEGAKKRFQKLQNMQANGNDVANDIKAVEVEIDGLNKKLNEMPAKKMQELADYAQTAFAGIGEFASNIDQDLGNLMGIAGDAVSGVAGIASGDPKAMLEGAMKLLNVAGKIIKADKEANEEIRKYNLSLAQQAIDYSLAVIRAIKDVKSGTDSLFSSNTDNTLSQGMKSYDEAMKKQTELMNQLGDATVKTGVKKKKFLGITYGHKDVFDSLLKQYPELINRDGELNKELAESIIKSGNLNEQTKALLENIISAGSAADEAMNAVNSELQNLVGSIGSELKKVLDDAFASGTDSGIEMANKIAERLKNISSDKLYNSIFGSLYADLEKRMKDSYGSNGDQNITDDIDWFMKNYPQLVDKYNAGLSELQKRIKEAYGIDPFATENGRTAVQKGIAQASQDSIDEVNGRLTSISGSTLSISENTSKIVDLVFAIFAPLNRIADNTDRLEEIEKTGRKTAETLEKMERDGINIKR